MTGWRIMAQYSTLVFNSISAVFKSARRFIQCVAYGPSKSALRDGDLGPLWRVEFFRQKR